MTATARKPRKPQPKVQRVVGRVLRALDRQIAAAEEARAARDALYRLALRREEKNE